MVSADGGIKLEELRALALLVQRGEDVDDGGRVLETELLRLGEKARVRSVEDHSGRSLPVATVEKQAVEIAVALVEGELHKDLAGEPGGVQELRDAVGGEGEAVGELAAQPIEVLLEFVHDCGEGRERGVVDGDGAAQLHDVAAEHLQLDA